MIAQLLDRAKFREWLLAKTPDEVVGLARRAGHCPLAQFLKERNPGCIIEVGYSLPYLILHADGTHEFNPIPEWATKLVDLVDEFEAGYAITSDQALALLDHIQDPL